ncbi:hypothetical protein ACJRO7_007353 [Eucalyptus globulus]|uniref:Cytochrome b5 heme-binding domain-containing protein n=1 Tax=Eucalyptus globulus TaxID=34317 RepID=A0ABD3IND3_EUCGL
MGLHAAAMEAVTAYTGLSPAAFFTILALMVAVYKAVCGMFVDPDDDLHEKAVANAVASAAASAPPAPPAEPVQLGDVTAEQLRAYDGSDPRKPLLMAIKGQIYDVSGSRMFYGPGGAICLVCRKRCEQGLSFIVVRCERSDREY